MTLDVFAAYEATRERISAVALAAGDEQLAARVPSCPDWDAHDLLAHCAGIPTALAGGDLPAGDVQTWLDGLVAARRDVPAVELVEQWRACGERVRPIVEGSGGRLVVDVLTHEHDLRGALGTPGDRDSAELRAGLQLFADLLAPYVAEAGLAPFAVESPDGTTARSGEGEPGWTLLVDPWEATRVLGSRRTVAEVLATPARGDASPYLAVIGCHLPLPAESLAER
jgi:uncharacterized protein (TIGR03083 family)